MRRVTMNLTVLAGRHGSGREAEPDSLRSQTVVAIAEVREIVRGLINQAGTRKITVTLVTAGTRRIPLLRIEGELT